MLEVKKEGVILKKTGLDFENDGVLNPAVIQDGDIIHMFYRAVRVGNYSTIGYCKLDSPLTVFHRLDEQRCYRLNLIMNRTVWRTRG